MGDRCICSGCPLSSAEAQGDSIGESTHTGTALLPSPHRAVGAEHSLRVRCLHTTSLFLLSRDQVLFNVLQNTNWKPQPKPGQRPPSHPSTALPITDAHIRTDVLQHSSPLQTSVGKQLLLCHFCACCATRGARSCSLTFAACAGGERTQLSSAISSTELARFQVHRANIVEA